MPSRRPNILIFMNDQEQAQVTMPGHPCRTPNFDRLAAEGLRLNRCYTPTAHCCPARATFMTGLYPSSHGVYNNILNHAAIHTDLYAGVPTWSELLDEAGYNLQWSGKWHVAKHRDPADCGWNERYANCLGHEHHGASFQQLRQRFETVGDAPHPRGRGELLRDGWGPYQHYGTQPKREGQEHDFNPSDYHTVQCGLEALDEVAGGEQPWCIFIGTQGPHDPYIVPEKYATMYDPATIEMPPNWQDDLSDRPVVYQRQHMFWSQLSPVEQREAVAHYWGYCTMQDDLLGLVMDRLEASGEAENTLLIYLSDHGDYSGAHGLWMKGIPAFDEAYHVPCAMRWPAGMRNPGRVIDEFVTLADFFPTFLGMAGMPPREKCHGHSLLPFFGDYETDDWPDHFCSQMNGVELYYTQRQVVTKEWKYVFNGFDWDELYHLTEDPYEQHNLAPRPGHENPDLEPVLRDLCAKLWRFAEATDDIHGNPYPTTSLCPFGPMTGMGD